MKTVSVLSICFLVGILFMGDALAQRNTGLIVWSSNRNTVDPGLPPDTNFDLWVMNANDGENRIRLTIDPEGVRKNEEGTGMVSRRHTDCLYRQPGWEE